MYVFPKVCNERIPLILKYSMIVKYNIFWFDYIQIFK